MLDASDILTFFGLLFLFAMVVGVVIAVCAAKSMFNKRHHKYSVPAAIVLVLGWYAYEIVPPIWQNYQATKAFNKKFAQAEALFTEKCKTAVPKVYQTVENIEGITLLKVWPSEENQEAAGADPMAATAGLFGQSTDDDYIRGYLYWECRNSGKTIFDIQYKDVIQVPDKKDRGNKDLFRGFRYVDVKQPDGSYLRYHFTNPTDPRTLTSQPIAEPSRYAVTFENPIYPEERKLWVATSQTTILDTQTNQVMATLNWYAFEPGLGNQGAARQPWPHAIECPELALGGSAPMRHFVTDVIQPKQDVLPQEASASAP